MPPSANIVSGKISVCAMPAFVASLFGDAARHRGRLRREGVQAARAVLGVHLGGDATLGHQQRAEDADQQQRALQEQCGPVDGDGAHRPRSGPPRPCRSTDSHDDGDQCGDLAADGQHQLDAVPGAARQERLDEHADARRRRSTMSIGDSSPYSTDGWRDGSFGRSFRHPGCRVLLVDRGQRVAHGGIDDVEHGFRINAEHQQQRDQRRHHDEFAGHQITQLVVAVLRTGPVIIRWYATGCRWPTAPGRSPRTPRRRDSG